jgi:protein ImuB
MCSIMIVCVLIERFELSVAAGGRAGLLGEPAALAPQPGRELFIGEVSQAAEAFGIHAGMRIGEALARCPQLVLVSPDPMGVAEAWECALARLESIGAAVESLRPGEACFEAEALRRLHGGHIDGVVEQLRRALAGARFGPGGSAGLAAARIGLGPTRFCAMVAAAGTRARRPAKVAGAEDLAQREIELLRRRDEIAALVEPLRRMGIATLGALAALPRAAVADRFGRAGLLAHDLAHGRDVPLRPRRPGELLRESLELPESGSGEQLGRALGLLIDRLLARRERRGRTLRAVVLSARLVEGGTWRERVAFREALADPQRMRMALGQRLALLPAPAETLELTVERFGPPHPEARALFDDGAARREERLREAVRQARAAAGPYAALRVLEIDPDSRVPERRVVLTPFEP